MSQQESRNRPSCKKWCTEQQTCKISQKYGRCFAIVHSASHSVKTTTPKMAATVCRVFTISYILRNELSSNGIHAIYLFSFCSRTKRKRHQQRKATYRAYSYHQRKQMDGVSYSIEKLTDFTNAYILYTQSFF